MDNQEAIEKLQSIANQLEDSLKRFLAREILTYDSPQEFFSLVKDYGMETLYHYEDLEEHEIPMARICNPCLCFLNKTFPIFIHQILILIRQQNIYEFPITTGDANGNAIGMNDLTYAYENDNGNSNLLKNVSDAVSTQNTDGFVDGNTSLSLDDYEYDVNDFRVKKIENLFCEESERSLMILDRNKGIESLHYNHLNLTTRVNFTNNKHISYKYNAAGQKLQKTVNYSDSIKIVDYLDGFQTEAGGSRIPYLTIKKHDEQYAGEVLQFFPHAEGYVKVTALSAGRGLPTSDFAFNYVFNYTDHLGNVRLSYTKDPQTGTLEILDENHYYPFGLKHGVYATGGQKGFRLDETGTNGGIGGIGDVELINILKTDYNYKYNGFEYQDELDLNWYDYMARNYDPALGRWMNIDPLVEMSRKTSPYVYALNNPVFFIDPDGMMAEAFGQNDVIITGTQSGEAFNQLQSSVEGQLDLTIGESGLVSYERTDMNGPLTKAAQGLIDAIDDHSVVSTITAENVSKTFKEDLVFGGGQMGTEITGPGPVFTVNSKQEVNPTVLGTMDAENGTPGSLIAHETTEAYQAGKITQQSGKPVGPATNADANNPQSNYSRAHSAASPQTSMYNTIRYDSNGNVLPGNSGKATRVDFTTQKGTLLYSHP